MTWGRQSPLLGPLSAQRPGLPWGSSGNSTASCAQAPCPLLLLDSEAEPGPGEPRAVVEGAGDCPRIVTMESLLAPGECTRLSTEGKRKI